MRGSGEWGVGSGEWGVGSGEWGVGSVAERERGTYATTSLQPISLNFQLMLRHVFQDYSAFRIKLARGNRHKKNWEEP